MGKPLKYVEFDSIEEYQKLFRECEDSKINYVTMKIDGQEVSVYVCSPGNDFLLAPELESDVFKNRWKIKPVYNLEVYRRNTDEQTYRVGLRQKTIPLYRKAMRPLPKGEGAYMPFLVFDAKRESWISGRHRSEASKNLFGAIFAVVFDDLTDEEVLKLADITNQWHKETWNEDERALVALDYIALYGWSKQQALDYVELKDMDWLLGAQLYRHCNQNPNSRELIAKEGMRGHPRSLRFLGTMVKAFGGEDAISDITKQQWIHILNSPIAKRVKSSHRGSGGGFKDFEGMSEIRQEWRLVGDTPKERYVYFIQLEKRNEQEIAVKKLKMVDKSQADDFKVMTFIDYIQTIGVSGLSTIKAALPDEWKQRGKVASDIMEQVFNSRQGVS